MALNVGDPALSGELQGGRGIPRPRPIAGLSLQQLFEDTAQSRGKNPELVDAVDIAEFLIERGASYGQFAQIFDPASLSELEQQGYISPPAPELFDPAITGEREAPLVGGEFSRRFLDDAQQGLRRDYEQQRTGTVNLAEVAFPASVQRAIDRDRMSEVGGEYKAPTEPWTPPLAKEVGGWVSEKLGGALVAGEQSGNEVIQDMVEAVKADEVNTAPMMLYDRGAASDYVEGWVADEWRSAFDKIRDGDIGGAIAKAGGSIFGAAGRTRDVVNAAVQSFQGHLLANILKENWVDSDIYAMPEEDKERLEWLATARSDIDPDVAKARRSFFNSNAADWFLGLKGLSEGLITLPIEIIVPGPKIPSVITNPVSRKAGLVKDLAKKKLPLPKLPKGASIPLHPSKMKEATWGKLSARQRRKIWRDTANRVNMMEDDLYTAVQTVIYGAGGNVQEMVRRIHSMVTPRVGFRNLKHISDNPELMDPNGSFMQTMKVIKGSNEAWETLPDGTVVMNSKYAKAYNDLQRNGKDASDSTFRLYDSDEPPPLPLGDLDLKKFDDPPLSGEAWSNEAVISSASNLILRRYAESIGWGYGQKVKRYGFWGEGNTNVAKWLSDQSKKHIGYTWLFGRSGFAVLNALGGTSMIIAQQGLPFGRYRAANNWFKNLEKSSKGAVNLESLSGYRAKQDVTGRNMMTRAMVGEQVPNIGTSIFAELPFIGDKLLPGNLPAGWMQGSGKMARALQTLNDLPGLGGMVAHTTTFTEQLQHRVIQTFEIHQTARINFNKMLADLDLPATHKNRLQKAFDDGDASVFDEIELGKLIDEMNADVANNARNMLSPEMEMAANVETRFAGDISASAKRRYAEIRPAGELNRDMVSLVDDAIEKAIEDASQSRYVLTPSHIRAVGRQVIADELEKTRRMSDFVLRTSPDGTVGKLGREYLDIFEDLNVAPDGETRRIIAEMITHDNYTIRLQEQALDAIAHRLETFAGAADSGTGKLVNKIRDDFTAVKRSHTKSILENVALMRRDIQDVIKKSQGVVGRLKGQTDPDRQKISEIQARFDVVRQEISERTSAQLESLTDRFVADEMVQSLAKAGKVAEGNKLLDEAHRALKSVGVRVGNANKIVDTAKKSADYKYGSYSQREQVLARAHRERMELIRQEYQTIADIHTNLKLPATDLEDVQLPQQLYEDVLRAVDAERGGTVLQDTLLSNDPTLLLHRHGEELSQKLTDRFEDIADQWGRPSPNITQSVADQNLTRSSTVQDIIRIRDASLLNARRHAADKSNEALFSYIYNKPEVMLQVLTPYPYWSMKFAAFHARMALKRPGQYAIFARLMADWMEDTKDLPDHLKMTIYLKELPDGTQIRFDPKILFGGPSATTVMGFVRGGQDRETSSNAYQMVQAMNMVYSGRAHPWISAVTHAGVEALGPERVQELVNNPEVYQEILGKYGYVPPAEEQLQQLLGINQRMATSVLAQGELRAPWMSQGSGFMFSEAFTPEVMYERGLTASQRSRIGHTIADMVEPGLISERDAEQAIIDIQQNRPNPIALEGMKRYFSGEHMTQGWNWVVGGFRHYTPTYQRSRMLNQQYRDLKESGRTDEAAQLVKDNPALPIRWIINDDLEDQEKHVNKATYWDKLYIQRERLETELASTDALDITRQRELREAYRAEMDAFQNELGLSDEDINPRENGQPIDREEDTGIPFARNYRTKSIKTLVGAFREMVKYEDFVDEQGIFNHEQYETIRDDWLRQHVPEEMRVEFDAELSRGISLPEAILKVYKEEFVGAYFDKTENMTADEKEAYMAENQVPSVEQLVRKVKEAYPTRNWVNKDEEIDLQVNDAKIRSAIEKASITFQGFLDVNSRDKIERVRKSTDQNPFAFKSKTGLVVNRETLGEYSQAYVDMSKFQATKELRDEYDIHIDSLTEQFDGELAQLSPMDFALGEDDKIRERYLGGNGTSGLIGRIRNLKKQAIARGVIGEWTTLADKWFGKDEYGEEDALREMRSLFYAVTPSSFTSEDGINWDAFNKARDQAFDEAMDLGKAYGITQTEFQSELDKRKVPSEAAWIFWQENHIGPALEERHALKDSSGRVSAGSHQQIAAKYARSATVEEILTGILKRFPHLTRKSFGAILSLRLPSFSEYWQARGYNTPGSGRGTSTRSYYTNPNPFAGVQTWLEQNPDQRLPTNLL